MSDARPALVLPPFALSENKLAICGGKAAGLLRLQQAGLEVPRWLVVTTAAFEHVRQADGVREALHGLDDLDPADRAGLEAASARLAAAVREVVPPVELLRTAGELLDDLDGALAVRSSAVGEDDALRSFAGQFDTVLGVSGTDELVEALRTCWASAWSARALSYRLQTGLPAGAVSMAVVVQELAEGDVSGVLFTVDPGDETGTTALVTATWGLGEGVVSGALATDTFRIARSGQGEVETDTADKAERLVRRPDGAGTTAEPVPDDLREQACLSDAQVRTLLDVGMRLERDSGRPQDVEWTLVGDRLVVLQTRPITGILAADPGGRYRLWDNSNIVESYPGVTTPLTFSFAHHAYSIVYRLFCETVGVPRKTIQRNDFMFESMIGLVEGRIYYNLLSWYRMFTLLPGYSYNRRFMEQMMGVAEAAEYEGDRPAPSWLARTFVELPRLLWVGARMLVALLTLDRRIAAFRKLFAQVWGDYRHTRFATRSPEQLGDAYRDLSRRLLWRWKAPILNDIFCMIFYGLLRRLVDAHGPDDRPALHNDLLAGEGGIESVEPTLAVLSMARLVRQERALTELFEQHPDDAEVLRLLRSDARYEHLASPLEDYLERWGYRCMEELKLESIPLKDDPTFLVLMIRNYVGRPDIDPDAMLVHEREVRRSAEAAMDGRIPGWWRRALYGFVLRQARRRVKERENLRFARTRVFGLAREIFDGFGRQLARRGALDHPRDVYWLTVREVLGFVEGTTPTTDLRGLVGLRRTEYGRFSTGSPPDDRFDTRGPVHLGNRFRLRRPRLQVADGQLSGTPCCPGVVRKAARVIRSPRDDMALDGEILVAERTDPGWVPLYPAVSGLLIERGSVLSHSAIVAREMGLPTIVGVGGLIEHVADGQVIEMDGAAGLVMLSPESESEKVRKSGLDPS